MCSGPLDSLGESGRPVHGLPLSVIACNVDFRRYPATRVRDSCRLTTLLRSRHCRFTRRVVESHPRYPRAVTRWTGFLLARNQPAITTSAGKILPQLPAFAEDIRPDGLFLKAAVFLRREFLHRDIAQSRKQPGIGGSKILVVKRMPRIQNDIL